MIKNKLKSNKTIQKWSKCEPNLFKINKNRFFRRTKLERSYDFKAKNEVNEVSPKIVFETKTK